MSQDDHVDQLRGMIYERDGVISDLRRELAEAKARIAALEEDLREVALAGVEFEDERVSYVSIQIDRELWLRLRAVFCPAPTKKEKP